ncbi:relaxase MobL [[Mycoplasma] collis]|uniref:relaxase MobL n=1 Tax=[Mycoplasma] collis TaxID=2127 RepID=UPI00051AB024|nr:relaxase MobL [[Mycoplasma] collis]
MYKTIFKTIRFTKAKTYYYKKGKYIDYITRKNAVFKSNKSSFEILELEKKFSSFTKTMNSLVQENENINSGLFTIQNNKAEIISANEAKKVYSKLDDNQLVWDTIVSLDYEILKEANIISQKQYADFLVENIKYFFNSEKFDLKNLNIFFSIHINTKNPHFHIGFSEKEPKRFDYKNNQYTFRKKGFFELSNIQKFVNTIDKKILFSKEYEKLQNFKSELWNSKKELKEEIKKISLNRFSLIDNVLKIKNSEIKNFKNANDEIKNTVSEIKNFLIKNNSEFGNKYKEFENKINLIKNLELDKIFNDDISQLVEKEDLAIQNEIFKNVLKTNYKEIYRATNINEEFIWNKLLKKLSRLPYSIYKIKKWFKEGYEILNNDNEQDMK